LFRILRRVTKQASPEEDAFVREVPVVWVEGRRKGTAGGEGGRKKLRGIFLFSFLKKIYGQFSARKCVRTRFHSPDYLPEDMVTPPIEL
jgi:hypothetical protein